MSLPRRAEGLLGLHLANLLLAGTALFPKLITLPADQIVALRSLVALAALYAYVRLAGVRLALPRGRDRWRLALVSLLMAAHWVSLFWAIQMTTVAVGLICLFTYPTVVVFLEPWLLGERVRAVDAAAGLAVIAGVYLVVPGRQEAAGPEFATGIALGLASAVLYALRHVLYRRWLSGYPSSAMMLYQVAAVALLLLPLLAGGVDLASDRRWLYLLLLGVFFTALPHTLLAHSLRVLRARTMSLVTGLQPVYGTLLAVLVLREIPDPATVAGGLLIVAAATFESLRR